VAEADVIGRSDELKGEAVTAFVTLKERATSSEELRDEIKAKVVDQIGKIARPAEVIIYASLPKKSSAKIMSSWLRDITEGRVASDTSILEDPAVVENLKEKYSKQDTE